jgi:hypothetical protein
MGTLKLSYLPRQTGVQGLHAKLKKLVENCEKKGISVHVKEI